MISTEISAEFTKYIEDKWANPEICRVVKQTERYRATRYLISVPINWVTVAPNYEKPGMYFARYALASPIREPAFPLCETVPNRVTITDYNHNYSWIRTTRKGLGELFPRLGYTIFHELPKGIPLLDAFLKAKLHDIDMRFVPEDRDQPEDGDRYSYPAFMCFRNEEDEAFFRLVL